MKLYVETLDELKAALKSMKQGQVGQMHYDSVADLFPPGASHEGARVRVTTFAKENGCSTDFRPEDPQVMFLKPA
jgi:hypothetical protein